MKDESPVATSCDAIVARPPRTPEECTDYALAVGAMDAAAATPEDAVRIVEMALWRVKHPKPTRRSIGSLAAVWTSGAVVIWLTDILFNISLAWTYVFVAASFLWQAGMLLRSALLARQAERLDCAAYGAARTSLDSRPAQFERALRLLADQPVPPLLPIETPKLIQAKIVKDPEIAAYRAAAAALANGTATEADARLVLASAAAERAPRESTRRLLVNGEVWIGIAICIVWMIQKYVTGKAGHLDNFSVTIAPVVIAFYVWAVRSRAKQTREIADRMAPMDARIEDQRRADAYLVQTVADPAALFVPQSTAERLASLRASTR